MKRVSECMFCGKSGCIEFEDKYYCFRLGVTRKKAKGERTKKTNRGFEGGLGETFSKVSPRKRQSNQERFDFGDNSIDAISL